MEKLSDIREKNSADRQKTFPIAFENYISSVKIHISTLKIYISSLEICKSSVKIQFSYGKSKFSDRETRRISPHLANFASVST